MINVELSKQQWWILIRAAVAQGQVMLNADERGTAEELSGIVITVTSQVLSDKMFDQIEGELNGDQ